MERAAAGKHLVQNRAERKDVGTMIDSLPAYLFGRHVTHRAHHDTRASIDASRRYICLGFGAFNLRQLGNSKVENLYAPVFGDEDVVGLQVTVNDPFLV